MALLRYPGGKNRYTDFILPTLYRCSGFSQYIEPFVGGGSVALAMAEKHPDVRLIINDLDLGIAALWDLIANGPDGEFENLLDRIPSTHPTVTMFDQIKASTPSDRPGRAFRALFLNRCSWGGMGWRPLGGKHQKSSGKIDSRWHPEKRVAEMRQARTLLQGRTEVLNVDFANVIPLAREKSLMFLDPPYYQAGNQLYNFRWTDADHIRLRASLKDKSNWVMSYDDHPFVRELYGVLAYIMSVQYSVGKNRKKMHELLLFPRLEFPSDFNPEVGVGGVGDTLRIWIEGYGPSDCQHSQISSPHLHRLSLTTRARNAGQQPKLETEAAKAGIAGPAFPEDHGSSGRPRFHVPLECESTNSGCNRDHLTCCKPSGRLAFTAALQFFRLPPRGAYGL
jgi:DNA adenine methylase